MWGVEFSKIRGSCDRVTEPERVFYKILLYNYGALINEKEITRPF